MAYYTTIEALSGRVQEIDKLIPVDVKNIGTLSNGLNLYEMQRNAVENLRGLLKALGYSESEANDPDAAMADLNRRIEEFHATTSYFNGPQLREYIMNPLKGIVVD